MDDSGRPTAPTAAELVERAMEDLATHMADQLIARLRSGRDSVIHLNQFPLDMLWTPEQRQSVMGAAHNNVALRTVVVSVAGMGPLLAKDVAGIVGRLPKVEALEIHPAPSVSPWPCEPSQEAVDAVLRGIVQERSDSATPITRLTLNAHCGPQALLDFVERFPGIVRLGVAGHCCSCRGGEPCSGHDEFAAAVAAATSRLAKLREILLHCQLPFLVTQHMMHSVDLSPPSVRIFKACMAQGLDDYCRGMSFFANSSPPHITDGSRDKMTGLLKDGGDQAFSPRITHMTFRGGLFDPQSESFPKALVAMQHVEVLHFFKCRIPTAFDLMGSLTNLKKVTSISRSSSVHADCTLQDEYDVKPFMLETNKDLERLCRVVENHPLEEVVLDVVGQTGTGNPDDGEFPAVARLLRNSHGTLVLNVGNLPPRSSEYLEWGIRGASDDLKELRIRCFRCGFADGDYADFLRPIASNTSLAAFELGFDPMSVLGTLELSVASLRELVVVNETLEVLSLRGMSAEAAASALAATVPVLATANRSLRTLELRDVDLTELWPTTVGSILEMLRTNGVLCDMGRCRFPPNDDPTVTQVQFLLKQNMYGRRFILQPGLVSSRGIWATILGRVSVADETAVMYAFLRSKPSLLYPPLED